MNTKTDKNREAFKTLLFPSSALIIMKSALTIMKFTIMKGHLLYLYPKQDSTQQSSVRYDILARNNDFAINNHFDTDMLNMDPSPLQISAAPVLGILVVSLGPLSSKFYINK